MIRLLAGDCRDVLAALRAESVQCVVTSPPYYGLRDYQTALWDGGDAACDHGAAYRERRNADRQAGVDGGVPGSERDPLRSVCKCGAVRVDRQIGLEATPDEYLATMVGVFREVRRVLRRDGTCWVNMGDGYVSSPNGPSDWTKSGLKGIASARYRATLNAGTSQTVGKTQAGLAPKQLLLMPARLALALQGDGWWVRSDIIWSKPNPMPESVTDRPTSAYEHVFLLTRSARYYYDADAVREASDASEASKARYAYGRYEGAGDAKRFERSGKPDYLTVNGNDYGQAAGRNLRNVWTIATSPFSAAHFATFPPELAERCIRAGTRPGDMVLDPFAGAGTTLLVADRLQRDAVGIELNTGYTELAMERCRADAPLFTSFPPAEPPEDERMADLFTDMAAD